MERSILDHARALISTVIHRPPSMDADTAMMGYVRENLSGVPTDFALRVMATAFVGIAAASDRANIIALTVVRELIRERDKCTDADLTRATQQAFNTVAEKLFPDELGIAQRMQTVSPVPPASGAKPAQDGPGNPHAVMALRRLGEIASNQ